MGKLEEAVDMLCSFGLSNTQARTYTTIVRHGPLTVREIANLAKIRRELVYRTVPTLEKMGLIEKTIGKPLKLKALPAEQTLRLLIDRLQEEAERKAKTLKTMSSTLTGFLSLEADLGKDTSEFGLLSERNSITNKTAVLLKNTSEEVNLVTSRSRLTQITYRYSSILKTAIKRGARIRVITELPEEKDNIPGFIKKMLGPTSLISLRYSERLGSHYMIIDGKEMLFSTLLGADLSDAPALWTTSQSLIKVIKKYFEHRWNSALQLRAIETIPKNSNLSNFLTSLKPTDHVVLFYENQESKFNVLFNYAKTGLENNEAVMYICSEANPKQIKAAMNRFGIDVEKHNKSNALKIISYDNFYLIDGKFSIANTMERWKDNYAETINNGFKGLRVTGEMACFFLHNLEEELLKYEHSLHRTLDLPLTAICAYNISDLNGAKDTVRLYRELVDAHGKVLFSELDQKLGKVEVRSM